MKYWLKSFQLFWTQLIRSECSQLIVNLQSSINLYTQKYILSHTTQSTKKTVASDIKTVKGGTSFQIVSRLYNTNQQGPQLTQTRKFTQNTANKPKPKTIH